MWDKMKPEHMAGFIDTMDNESEREYKLESRYQWLNFSMKLFGTLISAGLFLFVMIKFLPSYPNLVKDILKFIAGGAAGFGLGYGIRRRSD